MTTKEVSTWHYDQYLKFMEDNPPLDDATAQYWGEHIVDAYIDGRLTEDQYFTLIDRYADVYKYASEYIKTQKKGNDSNIVKYKPKIGITSNIPGTSQMYYKD